MNNTYIYSHKMKKYLSISLLIAVSTLSLSGCNLASGAEGQQNQNQNQNQTEQTINQQQYIDAYSADLTEAELKEDFDAFMTLIEDNYPFIEVNARLSGINFPANRSLYWDQIKDSKTALDLSRELSKILGDLHNGHTHIVRKGEMFQSYYQIYSDINNQSHNDRYKPWVETFEMPNAIGYYKPSPLTKTTQSTAKEGKHVDKNNIKTKTLADGKAAYVNIKSFNYYNIEYDQALLKDFFKANENTEALIIDLRENSGGSTNYWEELIIQPLISKPLSTTYYTLYKNGENNEKFLNAIFSGSSKEYLKKTSDLTAKNFPAAKPEVFSVFSYYSENTFEIRPKDSTKYKGQVYLLVGPQVYSASEAFASFAKESGFAKLVGTKTGGDGLGSDPVFYSLPNSGIVIRYSLDYGMLPNGSANEEFHTLPDYEVTEPSTSNPETDPCVLKILELEGL